MNKDFSSKLKVESRAIRLALLAEIIVVLLSAAKISQLSPAPLGWSIIIGLIGMLVGIVTIGSFLWVRYAKQPEVAEKEALAQEQQNLEGKIAAMQEQISRLEGDRTQIDKNEQTEIAKWNAVQQEQLREFTETRLQQDIIHRQSLQNALRHLQNEHIRNGLLKEKLSETIPPLKSSEAPYELLALLAEHQIFTANDLIAEWLDKAGVSSLESQALLAWRQQLEIKYQNTQPLELNAQELESLNQGFETQTNTLEQAEMQAKITAEKDLHEIREGISKIRERNKTSINVSRSALRGLQDKHNALKNQQKTYERISFNQFFNLTLCATLGFNQSAYGIAASIIHTTVWGLLVLQIGLSIRATQLMLDEKAPQPIKSTNHEEISLPDDFKCIPTTTLRQMGIVTRVIDGDTIEVQIEGQSYRVRYLGMDAPEPNQAYGGLAYRRNVELVAGEEVILIKDQSDTDQFGRLLRYVLVGDEFVNDQLVREGYARATAYAPDLACQVTFEASQQLAQTTQVGLWFIVATPSFFPSEPNDFQAENLAQAPCSCQTNSLNCTDFATHADAQVCYEYCLSQGAGDIHQLDGNADGIACESLP